ncbi:DUF432 domain-containing protein [Proteobacteria bacterium 005FR1]|nr:DUF432 domain-containing protein [Proteobacteria bacterium 005FR1]
MSQQVLNSEQEARHTLAPWWKPVHLAEGQCWRYAIGPLSLYLQRHASEWWLASESRGGTEDQFRLESSDIEAIPEELTYTRYAFSRPPASFCLKPRLLDRPVVVRTNQAVNIPPDQKITFFISTPVCVSVELTDGLVLQEVPVMRLSDTWFGPSTRVGELCYAARTQARNTRSEVPLRPHRAVTPVTIHNRSDQMMAIDKVSLPAPFLPVYGRPDGTLWTVPLTLEHLGLEALAKVTIGEHPPEGVSQSDWLTPARDVPKKSGLVRAFVDMFSE